jgi:deoxyribose-phosphate aldolase
MEKKMLSRIDAAKMIDISAVRTHHTLPDIMENVELAKKYRFINVHVLPNWVKTLAEMLKDVDGVYVGAPVGFPGGGHCATIKIAEAEQLIRDGVEEMDIVMNVGRFRNKEYAYVLNELTNIISLTDKNIKTKVIMEINVLNDDEVKKACELIIESGADFIKTGTGWIPGNANIERIRMIKDFCGSAIKIKAAGGIRTVEEFNTLRELGVDRMGINTKSAIEIVEKFA